MNGMLIVDGIVVSAYTNGKGHGLLDKARAMGIPPTFL